VSRSRAELWQTRRGDNLPQLRFTGLSPERRADFLRERGCTHTIVDAA